MCSFGLRTGENARIRSPVRTNLGACFLRRGALASLQSPPSRVIARRAQARRGNLGKALPFGTSHRQNGNRPRLVIARRRSRRGNLGKALPFGTSHRQNGNRPRLVIARMAKPDVAISGRHFQFVQGTDKNVPTNCVCSGAHCAAVGGFAALRMRRAPCG